MRLAVFGIRSIPPKNGSAGADTTGEEIYTRIAEAGHDVLIYCRKYNSDDNSNPLYYRNLRMKYIRTVAIDGFDSLIHSFFATIHIILTNSADIVHIHNGGNSIWAIPLRISGKKVYVTQDGLDWDRSKWGWMAKLYLRMSMYVTATIPNGVIFDNQKIKEMFEKKYNKKFRYIPYGANYKIPKELPFLVEHNLIADQYFLFVGRFIPEKGIHYLLKAFELTITNKKLILIGGAPNFNSSYKTELYKSVDIVYIPKSL